MSFKKGVSAEQSKVSDKDERGREKEEGKDNAPKADEVVEESINHMIRMLGRNVWKSGRHRIRKNVRLSIDGTECHGDGMNVGVDQRTDEL